MGEGTESDGKVNQFMDERGIPRAAGFAKKSVVEDVEVSFLEQVHAWILRSEPSEAYGFMRSLYNFANKLFWAYHEVLEDNNLLREKIDGLVVQLIKAKMERLGMGRIV